MNSNTLKWIWLTSMSGMNSAKITSLLNVFDGIEEIYCASADDFKNIDLIKESDIKQLVNKSTATAERILKKLEKIGAYVIDYESGEYPNRLKRLADPPYVLYVRGKLPDFNNKCVSIGVVGTRRYSEYGEQVTKKMCFELARSGFIVISGMARGIDTFASISTLRAGSETVVVLGCGVDVVYPPENVELMNEIIRNGAVISEYPPMSQPLGFHFPERNRIIAALSDCLLVTEAPKGSGALITARRAYEMNVNIFAVPGSVFAHNSVGTNNMIKAGIKSATSPKDIIDEYALELSQIAEHKSRAPVIVNEQSINNQKNNKSGKINKTKDYDYNKEHTIKEKRKTDLSHLSEQERLIVKIIEENGKISCDELIRKSDIDTVQVNQILPLMEIMGIIKKLPGNHYIMIE